MRNFNVIKIHFNRSMILILLLLTGCGQDQTGESVDQVIKPVSYISTDDFKNFQSSEIEPIQSEIAIHNQDISHLQTEMVNIQTEFNMTADQVDNITAHNSRLVDDENQNNMRMEKLEVSFQSLQKMLNTLKSKQKIKKAKLVKPVFPYEIQGISLWGNTHRMSIKLNDQYIFVAKGDSIQQWRVENIDFDNRTVSLVHQKGSSMTRTVQ